MTQDKLGKFKILHNDKVCDLYDSVSVVLDNEMQDTMVRVCGQDCKDNKGMQNFGKQLLLRPRRWNN
jgi:hypothetical protein